MSGLVKILWASPLPPVRSGVSDYAMELLAVLAVLAGSTRIRIVAPPGWEPPADWPLPGSVAVVSSTEAPAADELQVVHLGNNPHHEWLLPRLAMPRTVVVLHDVVLHHLLVESTIGHGRDEEYERALVAAHGENGRALARARRHGITGQRDPFLFPAFSPFVAQARGLVVHSDWARSKVLPVLPQLPICRVALSAMDPGSPDRPQLRRRIGAGPDELVLMHLGFLTPEKGMHEILASVAAARRLGAPVRLVLVGEGRAAGSIEEEARHLGIAENVSSTGWVARDEMLQLPAAADLGVVLRRPSAGETSAAVLRFIACGTPVAVNGLHQFLEWPEAAAPRITPGPAAVAELTRLLVKVARTRDEAGWLERRRAARAVFEQHHRPEQAAAALLEFLGSL